MNGSQCSTARHQSGGFRGIANNRRTLSHAWRQLAQPTDSLKRRNRGLGWAVKYHISESKLFMVSHTARHPVICRYLFQSATSNQPTPRAHVSPVRAIPTSTPFQDADSCPHHPRPRCHGLGVGPSRPGHDRRSALSARHGRMRQGSFTHHERHAASPHWRPWELGC